MRILHDWPNFKIGSTLPDDKNVEQIAAKRKIDQHEQSNIATYSIVLCVTV
jgi:hypothetical protein